MAVPASDIRTHQDASSLREPATTDDSAAGPASVDEAALPFLNISGYRFVDLPEESLPALRLDLLELCQRADVRGTILLSPEGINVMLCGRDTDVHNTVAGLARWPQFEGLWLKESKSLEMTFSRLLVKIKREIIPLGDASIRPAQKTGPYLSPEELKTWYDEDRSFVIVDTRNEFEIDLGSFEGAIDLGLSNFRSLKSRLSRLDPSLRDEPIVTYCTGGVRCEKVTAVMMEMGFSNVFQLEGGIINYFERCGGDHFDGECFVFDKRVAIDDRLQETATTQCYKCQHVLTQDDQLSPQYHPGVSCPYCPPKR